MGYRSNGAIWIPKDTREQFKNYEFDFQHDLDTNWEKSNEHEDVWHFEYWKWYTSFDDVKAWDDFVYDMRRKEKNIDLIVIGEDNAIVFEPSFEKFGYSFNIEVY